MADEGMRERIARAICFGDFVPPQWGAEQMERHFRQYENGAMKAAGAVLAAMRLPTDAMIEAPHEADLDIYWGYHADGRPGGSGDVWRCMIDAAAQDGE